MRLKICCENRLGITQDILEILVRHQIDLQGIEVHAEQIYLHFPSIEFAEFQHLMPEIRLVDGVSDVKTVSSMPFERQHYELMLSLKSDLEPALSIDEKGKAIRANQAALNLFNVKSETDLGQVSARIKGINIQRWLDQQSQEKRLQVGEIEQQTYQIEFYPLWLPAEQNTQVYSGAFIRCKLSKAPYPQANQQAFILNQVVQHASVSRKMVRDLKKLSRTNLAVVFEGEAGTGKHFFATLCHYLGGDSSKTYQSIECIGLKPDRLNTQLSALADEDRLGSVIFRHVDMLEIDAQKILLAYLKQNTHSGLRFMFTSQQNLEYLQQEGAFNENLSQTITQLVILVPALRDRKEDLPNLIEILLKKAANRFEKAAVSLSNNALSLLLAHPWLGNVTQLEKAINQAILTHNKDLLEADDFNLAKTDKQYYSLQADLSGSLDDAVKRFENALLRQLYPHYPSTRQLAQKLGLSHTAIANKLREYGINKHTVKVIK
ncbi:TyrR/PhhR family helix-turn-helix DNA-binding protein [Catenovulum adriaticum]|uniref:Sigma 54-interacting transcriptional regulator n=1 Tax=Catenovulum adriaticum TaxID=2984846 RepID=A0ABY7AJI6_9ALTE|nr:TyrR/PhhR family helix-turn-helix DNA-binding protein [Catenovulum sp. TS8]WAJ69624.1 sigma 54-interacting transcriptional regulator [Catenovulum sp. TS8]